MRVLLLSDPKSIHTIRWARSLAAEGVVVSVFGFNHYRASDYENTNVQVFSAGIQGTGVANKLRYLTTISQVKRVIKNFRPDIVHAHYASSYGLLAKLSGFKPLIISVWGSDVFDFPLLSPLHKLILEMNLAAAQKILSTSHAMARETARYVSETKIDVTPFGIDLQKFHPVTHERKDDHIKIGTIKSLSAVYGIDILIRAFALVRTTTPIPATLVIAGEGKDAKALQKLARDLGIAESIEFLGKIPHDCVPHLLNSFAIFCALSNEESFGVAVAEASACALPVVVSNAVGLAEVVEDGVSGIVVPKANPAAAASAIQKLISNRTLREQMGRAGRLRVEKLYNWNANVQQMISIYESTLHKQ